MTTTDNEQEDQIQEPLKVDKWDGCAVKNALDDAVKTVLIEQYGYDENYRLMDIRLGICLTSVGAAMFALAWDYMNPFPASKPVLIACVLTYFALMAVLTFYTTLVEKGIFLEALKKDPAGVDPPARWTVSSNMKRFDDMYSLSLEYSPSTGGKVHEASFEKSVSLWFTEDGELLFNKFAPEVSKLHDSLIKKSD